ncbi:MAG: FtsQ-type POTRA domain-containing protein [Candidatus Omnitrophica bacterium]|nr:FtsQ-type POTRA domain-containing protein [Candidatus Omnitrophota bacterium]
MPKKNPSKPTKKKKRDFPLGNFFVGIVGRMLRIGIPLAFFGFFFFFLSKATLHFLSRSPYFSIETVEASSSKSGFAFQDQSLMGSLLGRNIFSVDLSALQEEVKEKHPELLTAKVERTFPNRIRIDVTPRTPVAQVQSGGYLLVDKDGVILPFPQGPHEKNLPIIVGVQEKLERLQVGYQLVSKALDEALLFVETIEKLPEFSRYVHTIDVSDYKNLSFRTTEGLEVKVGHGDFKEKLYRFDRTRVTLGGRIGEVKYIDLRFDEVVIGSR